MLKLLQLLLPLHLPLPQHLFLHLKLISTKVLYLLSILKHQTYSISFIIFLWFQRNSVDTGTFWTFNQLTHSKAKAYFRLAATTYNHSIERIALIDILARSASKQLSVSGNKLNHSTKVAGNIPFLIF